jgi:mercuric ion transport protein
MSTTPNEQSCCPSEAAAQEPLRKRGLGAWATAGALVSAMLASACCWLPLLAIAFGASVAGAGAFFEQYRPYFLAVAAALLAAGFYFLYIRKENCEPGSACAVPNRKTQRFNKAMFWVAALLIGAFASFPNYVGLLLGGTSVPAASAGEAQVILAIEGMTCAACAAAIRAELTEVPGVAAADVLYEKKQATVQLRSGATTTDEDLLAAIERAGYRATLLAPSTGGDR